MCCGLKPRSAGVSPTADETPALPYLLLVAQSARMLAQSAARTGISACVIDHFADADTRRYAHACIALAPREQGFDDAELLTAAKQLAPGAGLIYGSGLDTRPDLLEKLAQGRELFGNSPEILRTVNTPQRFFSLLDSLGIPYPETRFSRPARPEGWLVKPGCGEGGKRVGFAATNYPPPADAYYQRQIQGNAHSMLFIADGKAARIIGFNTQSTACHDPAQPFLFAGAVNRAELDAAQRCRLEEFAGKLTAALGLVGLNSLDFMVEDGEPKVLELNPRPSATMALYDDDFDEGLLAAHIAACRGQLPVSRPGPVRALRIVYAPQAICISEGFQWPEGCADLPHPGAPIKVGEPLCSLIAQGEERGAVAELLDKQEAECLRRLLRTSSFL